MAVSKPKIFSINPSHSGQFHDLNTSAPIPSYASTTIPFPIIRSPWSPPALYLIATSTTLPPTSRPEVAVREAYAQYDTHRQFNNRILAILLGGAVPEGPSTRPTTLTTPHSPPWRQTEVSGRSAAATRTRGGSKVYSFVANATDYTNLDIAIADNPLTNTTGIVPGPLNVQYYVPITAPNTSAVGAGGGAVFVASGVDTSFTAASVPAPVNLTTQGEMVPWLGPRVAASSSNTSASGSGNGAAGAREGIVGATVLGALFAGIVTVLLA
ncbi:hypothetical protein EDB85DRAFT_1897965 [Lactarius pseudohatsudake]|nr:hypothetical protein EDB85DRAFT_1897965 [Lactarius pseudohatsudake]